ncbi:MAG: hypothetical protein NZ842_06255, partial [Dehalococcoidia bacterium]|nr:hypothetical protein [Dehalococcoidia bacterium]
GEHNYDEEEIIAGLSRQSAMGAVRDVAETTYEDSEHRNYDIDVKWSASIKDRPFGRGETRKVVEIIAYVDDVTHDPDNFADEAAREVQYITEAWEEIDAQIEAALKEDGWMIETPYDKLETDPEHPGKLGPESFDLFNISKGDRGIAARLIIPMKGYPAAGLRQDTTWSDAKVLYKEGPKFIELMRNDGDDGWTVSGGYAILPPKRRNSVLNALKKEIMDASRAAAMQPSLPMGDLPASKKKDMKALLPAIENVQILLKQVVKGEMTPYRKKGSASYEAEGGIMFTFKPDSSQEQIETNLRFVKYFDDNPEPVQAALQKEWDEIINKFEADQPLVEPEAKKEKEPETEPSHLDAYKESLSSFLRNLIQEEIINEAKFENEATRMTRDIVKNIKDHLRAYKGEPRIKPRFGELKHPLKSKAYDNKYFGGLPKSLADEGIKKVSFQLQVDPSTAFGEGIKFGVSGKTMAADDDDNFGKGEMVRDRSVIVKVYLSDEFRMTDMSALVEKIKDTTVHEITHGGQSPDLLKKSGQAQMKAFQYGLTSIDALRLYYLDPAETESYARGTYKRAKMSKMPFSQKLDETIEEFLIFYAHPKTLAKRETQYTEEEVTDFFRGEYRQSIIDYAK